MNARLLPLSLLAMLPACSGIRTTFDYDPATDFSRLRTYAWQTDEPDPAFALSLRRAQEAIREVLQAKGYTMRAEDPDFRVCVHFTTRERVQVTDWGYGYGHYHRYYYAGPSRVDVYTYTEGAMILDIVDAGKKEILWRGVATGTVDERATPEERTERTRNAVGRLLEKFPP